MKLLLILVALTAQAATLRYWIEPCPAGTTGCHSGDPELAQWAMQAGSGGRLTLEPASAERDQRSDKMMA
jgi:hypothetical protein